MDCRSVTFEQVASALESHASAKQTISYNDFADEVGLPRPNNLFANSALKAYFEQIDWDDAEEERPFRTALVVKKGTGLPGTGFYKSLKLYRGSNPECTQAQIWQKEIDALFDYYKPGQVKKTIQIELSRAQHERLMRLCEKTQLAPELLLQGRITDALAGLENELAKIQEAHEQIERGEFYTSEEVLAHINQMFEEKVSARDQVSAE
jgi:predicted transcriptional regulator